MRNSLVTGGAGHDRRYVIDTSKLKYKLKCKADEDFESCIVKTVQRYVDK